MEWRQQSSVSCADAFVEAQRWIEEVTGKSFGCNDFRAALENGVLLCDLINKLKPGIIKRVNRLSTPIAGLDNVNVFLKACGKLGLNVSQLFHPGDLQDLSTRATLRQDESKRRLKNVLITIYWLGRKAQIDDFYNGPQLNFKAFEGLLGLALSKALDEGSSVYVKEGWFPEREECRQSRQSYKLENPADSIDSLDPRVLLANCEGCGSDAEAEQVFKMELAQIQTKQNKGYIPPPLLRRKQGGEADRRSCASVLARAYQIQVRPERPVQVNPGWIWSKSLSDIPMFYPARKVPDGDVINGIAQDTGIAEECNQENSQTCSIAAKDSEAQWQDDLTKWKNRRRSTKSDLRRKSQDREHVINQMINGAVTNSEKNEAGGLLKREQQSPSRKNPAPRPASTLPSSKSLSVDLQPRTRALLTRSYATEAPFGPAAPISPHNSTDNQGSTAGAMPTSDGNILGEKTHYASLASGGAGVTLPSLDRPFSSQTHIKAQGSPAPLQTTPELAQPESVFINQISTLITTLKPNETTKSTSFKDSPARMSSHKELGVCTEVPAFYPDAVNQASVGALEDNSQEKNQKISSEPALEQSRGQQAADIYKYLSKTGSWSRSASLPRGYRRSEGSCRLSSAITAKPFGTKQSRMSSLPRICNVDDNQNLKNDNEEIFKSSLKRQTANARLTGPYQASVGQTSINQGNPNCTEQVEEVNGATSSQTNGYHHQTYTQAQLPYSNRQTHPNKSQNIPSNPSDEHPKVGHSDMRMSLSLKPNSRPNFGFQTHWDSTGARINFIQPGSPAELCQLRVDDEIVAVNGVPVAHMNYSQWKDKMTSSLHMGSITMDVRRYGNKDWSSGEGRLLIQPGQSRVILNLTTTAPVFIGCPDHHNNPGSSTDTTVTKFNGQTENVKPAKVIDGELADSHRTPRNKGGSESAISDLQVPSLSPSSSSWSWDYKEERRRQEKWQEEQERLLQEQYQRDQERLEAKWRTAQQAMGESHSESGNTFNMTNGGESHANTQQFCINGLSNKTREEEQNPDTDELKEMGTETPPCDAKGVQCDKITDQTWAKSLSTPALAWTQKPMRGEEKKGKGQSVSNVEVERQQILEEMKKRTQLLTDNSWIRQRNSSSVYKEPIYVGFPLKRFESLDNLDTLRQSSHRPTTFSYPRPHSAAAYCAPSRNATPRYSTGSVLTHRNASMDPSHHGRMVSGRRTCCVCERVLGSGAAMVVEALSLCFHLACFQCVGCDRYFGGIETGVQVRIRNRKPYCEPCYFQLKSTGALSV